jgi:hypothetical protein
MIFVGIDAQIILLFLFVCNIMVHFYYLCILVIGVAAWLVGKYLKCHQLVLVDLFSVLVCVLEVQTHKR